MAEGSINSPRDAAIGIAGAGGSTQEVHSVPAKNEKAQMVKLIVPSRMKAHPSDRRLFLKLRGSFPIAILPKVRRNTAGRGVRIVLLGDNGQLPEGPVVRAACFIRR